MKTPVGWRKGQTIFNFLDWLGRKGYSHNHTQSHNMVDPFYIRDEDWDKFYEQFLEENHAKL
jgi:hypothetical protein